MTWYLVKSEQAFLVKIWLTTYSPLYQDMGTMPGDFLIFLILHHNQRREATLLRGLPDWLSSCGIDIWTSRERERGKITRLQSASVWRNGGGKEMDEYWVGKGLGVRERTGMPLLWLFPALPCPSLHTACYLAPCLKLVGGSPTQEWVDGKSGIQLCNTLVSQHYSTRLYLPFSPTRSHRSH